MSRTAPLQAADCRTLDPAADSQNSQEEKHDHIERAVEFARHDAPHRLVNRRRRPLRRLQLATRVLRYRSRWQRRSVVDSPESGDRQSTRFAMYKRVCRFRVVGGRFPAFCGHNRRTRNNFFGRRFRILCRPHSGRRRRRSRRCRGRERCRACCHTRCQIQLCRQFFDRDLRGGLWLILSACGRWRSRSCKLESGQSTRVALSPLTLIFALRCNEKNQKKTDRRCELKPPASPLVDRHYDDRPASTRSPTKCAHSFAPQIASLRRFNLLSVSTRTTRSSEILGLY